MLTAVMWRSDLRRRGLDWFRYFDFFGSPVHVLEREGRRTTRLVDGELERVLNQGRLVNNMCSNLIWEALNELLVCIVA